MAGRREARVTLEEQVVALLAQADVKKALTLVLRAHGPEVLGFLENALGDPDDARDVFQGVSTDLWKWLPSFRGGSLRSACYRVAWHSAARFKREAWHRRRERMRSTMASRIAATITSPESRLATKPRDRLHRLRAALDAEERMLLILRLDRELAWNEVAEILSSDGDPVDSAAVRKRFERVKDKLSKLAKEQGLI